MDDICFNIIFHVANYNFNEIIYLIILNLLLFIYFDFLNFN